MSTKDLSMNYSDQDGEEDKVEAMIGVYEPEDCGMSFGSSNSSSSSSSRNSSTEEEKVQTTINRYDPEACGMFLSSCDSPSSSSSQNNGTRSSEEGKIPANLDIYDPTDCCMTLSSLGPCSSSLIQCGGSKSSEEENCGMASSPNSSQSTIDDHRPLRKKRKSVTSDSCPVCGITLRHQQIEDHYELELRKLESLQRKSRKPLVENPRLKKLQEVRDNRKKRSLGSKQLKDASVNTCQVCHPGDDTNEAGSSYARSLLHLTQCAGMGNAMAGSIIDESHHSHDEYNEYSVGGEQRIRISSFLGSINDGPHYRIQNTAEDCHVVIDTDDDDATFGPSEFTERDLQPCESTLSDENVAALREAVLSSSESRNSPKTSSTEPSEKEDDEFSVFFDVPESKYIPRSNSTDEIQENRSSPSANIVMSALRSKLQELEREVQNSSAKCNICLEAYKEPLVSVTCWHVSCKECWMKTLGEKKLCPQCTKITLPANLRRIFM